MSWMLENNVAQVGVADVQAGNFSNIGVLVPTGIVPFCGKDSLRAGSAILLPFVRKLIRGIKRMSRRIEHVVKCPLAHFYGAGHCMMQGLPDSVIFKETTRVCLGH